MFPYECFQMNVLNECFQIVFRRVSRMFLEIFRMFPECFQKDFQMNVLTWILINTY